MERVLQRRENGYRYVLYAEGRPVFETRVYRHRGNADLALKRIGWICLTQNHEVKTRGARLPCVEFVETPEGCRFYVLARNGIRMGISVAFESEGACRAQYEWLRTRLLNAGNGERAKEG